MNSVGTTIGGEVALDGVGELVKLAVITAVAAGLMPATPAQADAPAKTVTAVATASIPISKQLPKTNAAIRRAVETARDKAAPTAVTPDP